MYRLILLFKLVGVLLYAGGLITAFAAGSLKERKRAVHAIASPGLVLTWAAGYSLTMQLHLALTELWIIGGLGLSLVSQLALVYSVSRDRRTVPALLATAIPLFLVLALMVFRPTWSDL